MSRHERIEVDTKSPPFDGLKGIGLLSPSRGGSEHARHQLYIGRDRKTAAQMLIKVTTRPGIVYERNLSNEIEILTTVNRELPASRTFPVLVDHGRLKDGRLYLMTYLFDELALATSVGAGHTLARTVGHLRTTLAVADALIDLHRLPIYHVDLNPMNILHRVQHRRPVVRIIDFESSYDPARHAQGEFYDPPTTAGFTAPEVAGQPPDARADVYSLGAVLYTQLAGFDWTWRGDAFDGVHTDRVLEPELRAILLSAVDRDPTRRPVSAQAFHDVLVAYVERIWPGRAW